MFSDDDGLPGEEPAGEHPGLGLLAYILHEHRGVPDKLDGLVRQKPELEIKYRFSIHFVCDYVIKCKHLSWRSPVRILCHGHTRH